MNRNIKYIILIAVVAIGSALTIKATKTPTEQPQSKNSALTIGSILPRSGDFAAFGEEIDRGARLAIADAQKSGIDVTYISEDDHSLATGTTDAANKLTSINKVDAALTATVQEVKPAAPIFNSTHTPLLAVWDSNDTIKTAGPYIFTSGFGTEAAGKQMANFAYTTKRITSVAVVSQKDDWSSLIADAFSKEYVRLGGTITVSEETTSTQRDFRTILTKIKQSNSDGLYAPMLPQAGGPLIKQARELGIAAPIMMGDSFSEDDVKIAGNAAEGVYFTNLYANDIEKLSESYKAAYDTEPNMPVFASFGYDAVNTLIAAHKLANEQHISLRDALTKTKLQGTGTEINFGGTQASERLEKIYIVKDGQFLEVK